MSELKARHIVDVYDSYYAENPFGERSQVYLKSEADKVIAEKDKKIAELIEKNKRLACIDIIMASETIKDLEESHKKEVGQLLMEISKLKKLVETADKLLKQRGGFTVNKITFNGVKLEGFKKEGV